MAISNEGRLAQINGRLKSSRVGVRVETRGDRLLLQATLPPKPGSKKTKQHQQRISLGYRFNPAGLQLAEQQARLVGAQLQAGQFDWAEWSQTIKATATATEWIDRFEADYFTRRERTPKSQTTWDKDYKVAFKLLTKNKPLDETAILRAVERTDPDSRTRKRACMALGALARFANLDINLKPYQGNYSPSQVAPQDLPDDELIMQTWKQIPNEQWKWVYGVIATYGIRPSEVFHIDLSKFPILTVVDGKTGGRRVWPYYPEWVDYFDVGNPKPPNVTAANNGEKGHRIAVQFRRYNIPFSPKMLRHAWAVRTIRFRVPVELAAVQQGHSLDVHTQIYHRWITDETHQEAFEAAMNRVDRPKPPTVT